VSEKQADKLGIKPRTQLSDYFEKCCLLVSANNSYQRSEEDLAILTGLRISHSTHQRLVHRQDFEAIMVETVVDTVEIDGGKVRVRTPKGQESSWQEYKAVTVADQAIGSYFQQNQVLVNWVNQQPLSQTLSCLGDGHEGIWNLFAQIHEGTQRYEILDWFHLMENLHNLELPLDQKQDLRAQLWQGQVDEVLQRLSDHSAPATLRFMRYLTTHRTRLPDYRYLHAQGVTIGSGAVESAVKQINRRLKISGAQWGATNVPQVLKHRCAYLNGRFTTTPVSRTA
jgi:hypothetical protein